MTIFHLKIDDYKDILKYYNIDYETLSNIKIQKLAETIISTKLCQCIKKVSKRFKFNTEQPAIAICSNSILKKHNLKYYGFSCDKKPSLIPYYYKNKKTKTLKNTRLMKQHDGKLTYKKGSKTRRKINKK